MWASIAAAAIAAGTSIYGGIQKSRQARKANNANQAELDRMRKENNDFYNRNYYSDATQLADNRAILTEAADRLRRENQAASGRVAVNGGSNSTAAAQKEVNNETYAGMIRSVAANAQSRKNAIQDNYQQNLQNLSSAQMKMNQSRQEANAAAVDTAVNGIGTMASGIISAYGNGDFKPKNDPKTSTTTKTGDENK